MGEIPPTPFTWSPEFEAAIRETGDGLRIALSRSLFGAQITVGPVSDRSGHREQWLYNDIADALAAAATWDGHGDPPGDSWARTTYNAPAGQYRRRNLAGHEYTAP